MNQPGSTAWLTQAKELIRRYDMEIQATLRRLAWGEQLDAETIRAFMEVSANRDRLISQVMRYLAERNERLEWHLAAVSPELAARW